MRRRTLWPALLWTLLVLYPNPTYLVVSALRAWEPVIDPAAVRQLAAELPDDPRAIEAAINSTVVPYAVPWQTYGVPWYFPTVPEVLERGAGDCQARAVVFASVLRAKGIPATLTGSFDHLWVEYPGKLANQYEQAPVVIVAQQADGTYGWHWPKLVDWRSSWEIERSYFWDAMPGSRLALLVIGWAVVLYRQRGPTERMLAVLRAVTRPPAATPVPASIAMCYSLASIRRTRRKSS